MRKEIAYFEDVPILFGSLKVIQNGDTWPNLVEAG